MSKLDPSIFVDPKYKFHLQFFYTWYQKHFKIGLTEDQIIIYLVKKIDKKLEVPLDLWRIRRGYKLSLSTNTIRLINNRFNKYGMVANQLSISYALELMLDEFLRIQEKEFQQCLRIFTKENAKKALAHLILKRIAHNKLNKKEVLPIYIYRFRKFMSKTPINLEHYEHKLGNTIGWWKRSNRDGEDLWRARRFDNYYKSINMRL